VRRIAPLFPANSADFTVQRNGYYKILERTQKGTLEISEWLLWFLDCLDRAITGTESTLADVLRKARFWEKNVGKHINDRQRLVLNKLLDGFAGKLTSTKWAKLTNSSQDTAYRDIQALIEQGLLLRNLGGGRSTSYSLVG
jgi:Fic family protein